MAKQKAKRRGKKKSAAGLLPKTRRIFVYEEDPNTLKVYPPVLVVEGGDEVELVNSAGEDVKWLVPKGPFDATDPLDEKVGKGKPSKQHKARKVTLAAVYTVKGVMTKRHAVGGSDPVIIIET